uniref:Uncharacterized protein n=1 Tax=Leersia perrieri TaxID=77586 RepID=A0A0D9VBT1_9ORYZ
MEILLCEGENRYLDRVPNKVTTLEGVAAAGPDRTILILKIIVHQLRNHHPTIGSTRSPPHQIDAPSSIDFQFYQNRTTTKPVVNAHYTVVAPSCASLIHVRHTIHRSPCRI